MKNIERPRPGDAINRGKISKKARKTPVFLISDVFNQKRCDIIYQNPKLGCSVTVFEVNDVHYASKRSDIKIMDRLNVPTKMNQNYGRSFLQLQLLIGLIGLGSKQK